MFLTSIDSRLLKLLSKLSSKQFNSIEELAKFMGVSTRTIQNYIKKLNEIMEKDIAEIINIRKVGYKLVIRNKEKFIEMTGNYRNSNCKTLMINTCEDRIFYIIGILLNVDGTITMDNLAYKINIGRTTLVNDLKKVKSILKIYNIKIQGIQNTGIKIIGNELNIRFLILDYLYGKFYNRKGNNELYNKIQNELIYIFNVNKLYVTDETLDRTIAYIFVMLNRIKRNKFIQSIDEKYLKVKDSREYCVAKDIKCIIEKFCDYKLNSYEVIFLTLPLLGREAAFNLENTKISSNVKQLVIQIINEVNYNFGLLIDPGNEIVKNLEYHLNFMLNRLIFNISIKNSLLEDIKKNYPLSYEMGKLSAKIIKQNYNLIASEDEIAYIALYFESYIEQNKNCLYNIRKVALICGTGLGTAQLLKIKLGKMLPNKDIDMDTFSNLNVKGKLLDNYDIVFTTVDLNVDTRTPVVKVNVVLDEDNLKKELNKIIKFKKYNIQYVEENMPILSIIIQPQFFFLLNNMEYLENLNEMLTSISQAPDIDNDFKKSVIKRELQSPTILGNSIAMPHAVNKKGNRLSMAVGILQKSINYDGNKVKIIIILIIPPEGKIDSEILIKAYDELLKLGQNKRIIRKISESKNYEDFKKILLEEVNL